MDRSILIFLIDLKLYGTFIYFADLPRPSCHQIYNLFYPSDPSAVRLEPLVIDKLKQIAPMKVPRYQKFPLGDGQSVHVGK